MSEKHIAQISAPSSVAVDDNDDDPEEVDISNHRYTSAANPSSRSIPPPRLSPLPPPPPSSTSSSNNHHNNRDIIASQEAELRRLLRGERPPGDGGGVGPNNNDNINNMENLLFGPREGGFSAGQGQEEEDLNPMRMLQQLMGGGGEGGEGKLPPGLPPGMAAMLGGMMPPTPSSASAARGAGGLGQSEQLVDDKRNDGGYLWKIVHAVFAIGLGIYITAMTTFSGAKSSSSSSGATTTDVNVDGEVRRFFWTFATAELVLQSTRFFMEKGRVSQSGWVGVLMGFLPEPYKGYLALGTRYGGIYTTVVQDAMAVLFVLGCVAWWKGAM